MKLISAAIGSTLALLGPLFLAASARAQTLPNLQPNSKITIDYIEPRDQLKPGPHKNVTGTDMGHMVLRDGSLASLPARVAYRIRAPKKSLVLLQTKHSEWLTYAWEEICLTEE